MRSQWDDREIIRTKQLTKLKKLVKHAYENVPLYKEKWDEAGVSPTDLKTIEDLEKFPIITKEDFRKGFPERCTDSKSNKKDWLMDSTSGSTGSPFSFVRDKHFSDMTLASKFRNYTWAKIDVGDKILSLWGYHQTPMKIKIFDRLIRKRFISAFDVEKDYDKYVLEINRYKPDLIEAYTASLVHFSKLVNGIKVKSAICSAETLYDEHRKLIEKSLGTEVFNRYGSREAGNIAHECEVHEGLHVNDEIYIVETVKNGKLINNQMGSLIVTNLSNFTMPFIRYDTEDYAVLPNKYIKCGCGRTLSRMKSVEGRVTDFIKLSNGDELSYLFFNYFFEQYGKYLTRFQVIQDKQNHLIINLETTNEFNDDIRKKTLDGLRKKLGGNMKIDMNSVKQIQKEKSGKIRPIKRLI